MNTVARTFTLAVAACTFGCGRSERSSGTPTVPVSSPKTVQSAPIPTVPLTAPFTTPPTSLCPVGEDPTKTTDWVKTLGGPFRIEYGGRWVLAKIHRPGSALAEVKNQMSDSYSEGDDMLIPCGNFVLLWMGCSYCNRSNDDTLLRIEKRVGKTNLLKLFEYDSPDAVLDCLNDRLPKPRCQKWFSGLSKVKDCGVWTRAERIQANKLLIHLDLEPPDSTTCLRPHDLQSHQPMTPTTNAEPAPLNTAEIDPLLLP